SMVPATFPTSQPGFSQLYGAGAAPANKATVERFLAAGGVKTGKVQVELWFSPTHYGDTEADVAETVSRSLEKPGRFDVRWANGGGSRSHAAQPSVSGAHAGPVRGPPCRPASLPGGWWPATPRACLPAAGGARRAWSRRWPWPGGGAGGGLWRRAAWASFVRR